MGLTLARRLAEAGQEVTLLESADEVGGLASVWHLGGIVWDRHYHVTLLSDSFTRQMLSELALEKDMRWVETKTGFYAKGKLYSMSNSWEFLRFPPLNYWEKLRLGFTIFFASRIRNWRKLENILVADWLKRWSGQSTFRKMWLPLLQAKLGNTYKKVSAAFIWATISRMYRARQTGLKKEMFGYLPGGYARILEDYVLSLTELGVNICCSTRVSRVTSTSEEVQIELVDGTQARFDKLVLTVPSSVVSKLCPQLTSAEHTCYDQIEYLGIVCASVVLQKPLANYYVTNIVDSGLPFTAVIEMTALVDPTEFGGQHLIYLPRYASQDDPIWQKSDQEIQEQFLAALGRMYAHFTPQDVKAFRLSRVRQVMALPTLNYSTQVPPIKTSLDNVFAVNSAQIVKGTLNVNEVIEIAENAFHDILQPTLAHLNEPVAVATHA
jgi:protoporphyrinogen oxidase